MFCMLCNYGISKDMSSDMMYPWLNEPYNAIITRIQQQRLHHGLLFIADQGVGETTLIEDIAQALICAERNSCGHCKGCLLFKAHSHPDIRNVVTDKPSIGVDLIRAVSEFVTSTSQMLGNKVVIIENIERMTESASNSLLKTLEEPNNNTFLLLTTNKPNALLATITSRCEKIRLSLPSVEISMKWLHERTSKTVDEKGLHAFAGSPIRYLASLNNTDFTFEEFSSDLTLLINKQHSGLVLADKWQKQASQALTWTYQALILQFENSVANTDAHLTQVKLLALIDDCVTANKKISQAGINKNLILQTIFNTMQAI